MDKTTKSFSAYASQLTYADLTPASVHAVKRCLVDALGCAFGAFNAQPVVAIRNLAEQVSGKQPATLIGTRIKSSTELAAFCNGAMIRYLDFNDDYFGGRGEVGPHPSDNLGSVLAAAESAGVDGKTLILGITVAYEACGQLTDRCTLRRHGWDYPVFHAAATALAVGKILGLSLEQTAHAVAMSVVPNICLRQTRHGELSNWKGLAGPNGSRNGLFAALLAQQGITGPAEPFEGKEAFMSQLQSPFELGPLGGRDTAFKVEGTYFKSLPVRYNIQLPVWMAIELHDKIKIEDITAIRVYLAARFVVYRESSPAHWDPTTRETADHSMPFLIAAALVDGALVERTFTPERYRDPVLLALTQTIHLAEDPQYTAAHPQTANCRFEVTLKSGETVSLHRTNPKGHPANPMSDRDIEDKFVRQTSRILSKKSARALLDQLWSLDQVENVQTLFALMQVSAK